MLPTFPKLGPNDIVVGAEINVSGNPLDFSFLGLKKIEQLKKEEARSGPRKPIENSDDEEEKKGPGQEQAAAPEQAQLNDMEGKKEAKEIIVKANYVPEIAQVLHNTDISLTAKGGPLVGGRKADDAK